MYPSREKLIEGIFMNEIVQDPFFYELLRDIQTQCSTASLEELARETGFMKRKRQMTLEASHFMCFTGAARRSIITGPNV